MGRAILMVFILLLVMAYLSLFLAWNAKLQPVVTWQLGAQYTQELPIGVLFILGVVVGAVAMAAALTSPWNALKRSEGQARTLLDKGKLRSQEDKIKALAAQLAQGKVAAPEPSPGVEVSSTAAEGGTGSEEGEGAEAEKAPVEDPETI
jgi:uncharacterized integral membrane protein